MFSLTGGDPRSSDELKNFVDGGRLYDIYIYK